jgi:hypothetical protein
MLYRDCTGKKVVPTIARGAKLGEGGKSLTLHFRHGANSSTGQSALPGDIDFRGENSESDELFGHQLSHLRPGDNNAVKKTGDWPPLFAVRDNGPAHRVIYRRSPRHFTAGNFIANHTVTANHTRAFPALQ